MSTIPSTSSSQNHLSAFKDQAIDDPYLSAPSDLEDFGISPVSPVSAGNRVTGEYQLDASNDFDFSVCSDPAILSSVHTSQGDDLLSFDGLDAQLASGSGDSLEQGTTTLQKDAIHIQNHSFPSSAEMCSQLLSPDLTNNPSPASDVANTGQDSMCRGKQPSRLAIPEHRPSMASLPTSSGADNLNINPTPVSVHSTSPVVKVSSYSRGDSPTREDEPARRRNSHSSNHLSPSRGSDDADEFDDGDNNANHAIPEVSTLRSEDGSWIPNPITGQAGIDPSSRGDIYVPSPNEMQEERRLAEKKADIEIWFASVSAATSRGRDEMAPSDTLRVRPTRRRARSAGDTSRQDYFSFDKRGGFYYDDSNIPGPGVLVDEASEESDSESEPESTDSRPESPVASVHDRMESTKEASPPVDSGDAPEDEEPLPRQFIRPYPWQDHPRFPDPIETRMQPATSREAIARFLKQAKNVETASHSATWGTKMMNDSEVNSLLESDTFFKSLSISKNKKLERSSSNLKRKMSQSSQRQSSFESDSHDVQDNKSESSTKPKPQRKLSFGRPKSPSLGTGSVVAAAIAGQVAASIGGLQATSPTAGVASLSPSSFTRRVRGRSKSDISSSLKLRLMDLTTRGGEHTAEKTTSPLLKPPSTVDRPQQQHEGADEAHDDAEDDDELMVDEKGVVMDFPLPSQPIIPTYEGFKAQISQLNPRIAPALLHRFAQEQVRRYKKLVQDKDKHAQAVSQGTCAAGKRCFDSGGQAELLPPRPSTRDPSSTYCQFQVPGHEISDDEPNSAVDGTVLPAIFPPGIPLPPVERLPAEFECPLCFKIKRFQKPSDWTKHVHEDVQPFTCTFPDCTEPKSFKRKADWVRHENERHRQLEWWTCNMPDCTHKCFRKDNFVQHLVREHKKPEPKVKKARSPVSADPAENQHYEQEIEQLWRQVDACHHVTTKQPQTEPCRFCGNICNNWKKLTVHLARHMEQISLPILRLVEEIRPSKSTASEGSRPQNMLSPISPATRSHVASDASAGVKVEQTVNANAVPELYYSENSGRNSGLDASPLPSQSGLSPGAPAHYPEADSAMSRACFLNPHPYPPVHRNSVSYPPPYNAMPPRQAASAADNQFAASNLASNPFGLTVSTLGANAIYDPQQELYASPTTENMYLYQDGAVATMPYDGSGGMDYQATAPAQGDALSSSAAYMPHPQSSAYQFQ
ncbi:hypothetical protein T310_7657 [Rasamsonia emersonii CBS 393.64]|uniref:C2H2-type domain-containing protein n=1 Tax=Rasamsonia emersonii (strain ATCC 16479 / CBS 393.64 / IMI 116815) TaxID=1408163 RepID=A0A0F4YJJ6_RASE3|nr:hypothetical protein T310_7657 [Rasamsonia emersonii CBS 393.64]KKA18394.1 hypothetical protein T310_7657 [Rasamsonia emersonii CBS 393.64]